jgi:hypothetical protein
MTSSNGNRGEAARPEGQPSPLEQHEAFLREHARRMEKVDEAMRGLEQIISQNSRRRGSRAAAGR